MISHRRKVLHEKAVISCTERHCTDLVQKDRTHANHRSNSVPHCSSIRSGRWEKKTKICSLQKTVKKSPTGRNKEERKSFLFLLLPLLKPKWHQNLESLLHKENIKASSPTLWRQAILALLHPGSHVLQAGLASQLTTCKPHHLWVPVCHPFIYFWRGWMLLPQQKHICKPCVLIRRRSPRLSPGCCMKVSHLCNFMSPTHPTLKAIGRSWLQTFPSPLLTGNGTPLLYSCLYKGQNRWLYPLFPSF